MRGEVNRKAANLAFLQTNFSIFVSGVDPHFSGLTFRRSSRRSSSNSPRDPLRFDIWTFGRPPFPPHPHRATLSGGRCRDPVPRLVFLVDILLSLSLTPSCSHLVLPLSDLDDWGPAFLSHLCPNSPTRRRSSADRTLHRGIDLLYIAPNRRLFSSASDRR